jgi:hypothetical protein
MHTQRTTSDTEATVPNGYDKDHNPSFLERTPHAFTTDALRRCLLWEVWQPGELFSHGVAGRSAQPLSFDWRMP